MLLRRCTDDCALSFRRRLVRYLGGFARIDNAAKVMCSRIYSDMIGIIVPSGRCVASTPRFFSTLRFIIPHVKHYIASSLYTRAKFNIAFLDSLCIIELAKLLFIHSSRRREEQKKQRLNPTGKQYILFHFLAPVNCITERKSLENFISNFRPGKNQITRSFH